MSPQAPRVHEAPGDGLWAGRDAPVGGQAVLEGVMMRGVACWAVAARRPAPGQASSEVPEGAIEVQRFPLTSVLSRRRVLRLPVRRGVVALGESLMIGLRALSLSADVQAGARDEVVSPLAWAAAVL